MPDQTTLSFTPIGYFRAAEEERYEVPRQSGLMEGRSGVIELIPGHNFEQALDDLDGFDRIWILYSFHRNHTWKPKVLPPRGHVKRGVFATRSPHRPNPIGMSSFELVSINGRFLHVRNHDLLDGTPILDIKPYVVYADAFPNASQGWLDELSDEGTYDISWSPVAKEKLAYLQDNWQLNLEAAVQHRLTISPHPYPNARICQIDSDTHELAYKSWRIRYHIDDNSHRIRVNDILSGYSPEALSSNVDRWGDLHIHREFIKGRGQV